jgi:hypothetical protein
MSTLSEVTLLIGQRAGDLEKAREIFTAETRSFVTGILAGIRRLRSEPWTTPRVRIDLPREIDTETKATGYLSSQFAVSRCNLRFKKGTNYQVVGEIRFGIEYDEPSDAFTWQITLVPSAKYQRIDDKVWVQWRSSVGTALPPESAHHDKTNTVRFVLRPVDKALTPDLAFNDTKQVLEFMLTADAPVADAVGLDLPEDDEAED